MHLTLKDIGPIVDAHLRFGDLTVFVGPQATGKSIALQFLKLVVDIGYIQEEMTHYGVDWSGRLPDFFEVYFGEGMKHLWREGQSDVSWDGARLSLPQLIGRKRKDKTERVFYIPAQRVLIMRDGWPQPFSGLPRDYPFVVREFSEKVRRLLEKASGAEENLFPRVRRLKEEIREMLAQNIFRDFELRLDREHFHKRLVLGASDQVLPYVVWSAGQREFVPLLLGLYWLMPSARATRRGGIDWIVLEELEMGLHARAIEVLLLMVFELVARGYRVCLSTHSAQVLEALWAIRELRKNGASPQALLGLFGAKDTPQMCKIAASIITKDVRVHYFDPAGHTSEISDLDPESEERGEGGWGGLIEFSGRANTVVARAVANARRRAE
jgi:hypothetical protein